MTQQLRDELARIADDAPPVVLPDDLWTRGRRARRQGRVLVAGAAACLVLALVGATTAFLGRPPLPQPAAPAPGTPGIPDRIAAVPAWMVDGAESRLDTAQWTRGADVEDDLAIGRVAALLTVRKGAYAGQLQMAVTADDGRYVPLQLPGYTEATAFNIEIERAKAPNTAAAALSEDGTRLAYGWWAPDRATDERVPSGIRVVDLETGQLTTIRLRGGAGIDVTSLGFSDDNRLLAWTGVQATSWRADFRSGSTRVAGLVDTRTGGTRDVAVPDDRLLLADVNDDGIVALWDGHTVLMDRDGRQDRVRLSRGSDSFAPPRFSPDGQRLVLSSRRDTRLPILSVADGQISGSAGPGQPGELIAAAGWTADGLVASFLGTGPRVLGLLDPGSAGWTGRVARMGRGGVTRTELATALMTADRPTVQRPAPDWPWSPFDRLKAVLWSTALLLLGGGLLLRLRLGRLDRPRPPSFPRRPVA